FKEPDLLIHLAWEGVSEMNSLVHIEKNLFSSYFFIKNMVLGGLKNLSVAGTCVEYGMKEGCLREDMKTDPVLSYALSKDCLRKFIGELKKKHEFHFKWIRLFYMYGKGQNPKSILSQLDTALEKDEVVFNMSGGEQLRDYLPVERVAEYIVKISIQNEIEGMINCCSGKPISIKELVEDHLKQKGKKIKLNLGYYPYSDYEPMEFWGDVAKLNKILSISS
ncbi:MAG TPA: NAD-dependent epimerase/dehydratase family protein, partial [Candidatus Paceibacterota bacterium]|nr:NAD-dependent epimerase/dehydratase family protein [Candidatus Paceibacterota bacterium]